MKTVVFCLEEPSAREMLKGLLPGILPADVVPKYIVFRGKQDLEKNLVRRLRCWLAPDTKFVVMRDQDAADCREVKAKLVKLCRAAGKPDTLVRVACRELESFYLGDLAAVEKGLGMAGLAKKQAAKKFRDPDQLVHPASEIGRLTKNRYEKIAGSRAIAPHMQLTGNKSRSFCVLIAGIKHLIDSD